MPTYTNQAHHSDQVFTFFAFKITEAHCFSRAKNGLVHPEASICRGISLLMNFILWIELCLVRVFCEV